MLNFQRETQQLASERKQSTESAPCPAAGIATTANATANAEDIDGAFRHPSSLALNDPQIRQVTVINFALSAHQSFHTRLLNLGVATII